MTHRTGGWDHSHPPVTDEFSLVAATLYKPAAGYQWWDGQGRARPS